jgi:hypothetical protein
MSSYWIWGAIVMSWVIEFAIYETWNLHKGTPTLSRSVWTWTQNFPLLPFLAGLLAGGLAVHFWWMGAPGLNCGG